MGVSNLQQTCNTSKITIAMSNLLHRPGLQYLYRVSMPEDLWRSLWSMITGTFTLGLLSWAIRDYRDWVNFGERTVYDPFMACA